MYWNIMEQIGTFIIFIYFKLSMFLSKMRCIFVVWATLFLLLYVMQVDKQRQPYEAVIGKACHIPVWYSNYRFPLDLLIEE